MPCRQVWVIDVPRPGGRLSTAHAY